MSLNITLTRPLIFFDIETTGADVQRDRIIELYGIKYNPDGSEVEFYSLFCPTIDIHPKATEVHGYTKEKLANEPTFQSKAQEVFDFFKDCDLAGYNILKFDIPILMEELHSFKLPFNPLKCNIIDPFNILYKYEPRTLNAIYKGYFGVDIDGSHGAAADVKATVAVFEKQVEEYNLPRSAEEISGIVRSDKNGNQIVDFSGLFSIRNGEYYYNIGKNKDQRVIEDMGYLDWVIKKSTMASNTKFAAFKIKKELKEQEM